MQPLSPHTGAAGGPRHGSRRVRSTCFALLASAALGSGTLAAAAPQNPEVSFELATSNPSEDVGTHPVKVVLSTPSSSDVTVTYTLGGTATGGGVDYTDQTTLPFTIPAGGTEGTIDLAVLNDGLDEPDESVVLTIVSADGADPAGTLEHTAVIADDDDAPVVQFQLAASSAGEGAGTASIQVVLSKASGKDVTVPFTVGGSAGDVDDYTMDASPLVILAGNATGSIGLTPVDDVLDEAGETVVLSLGSPTNATLGGVLEHTLTIEDDDAPPSVEFVTATQTLSEGAGSAALTVQLSAVSGQDVTVPFTLGGSAEYPDDYGIDASPIVVPAGDVNAQITLTVVGDDQDEEDEDVVVTLGVPTNGTLGATDQHTATIQDDDAPPVVSFALASQTVGEGAGTVVLDVLLSDASGLEVSVPFLALGTATEGVDFDLDSSPLVIPAGDASGQITVTVTGDDLHEDAETIEVELGDPTNGTLGSPGVHLLTISDDDDPPVVSFVAATGSSIESAGVVPMTLELSAASGKDVSVPYTLDGTASPGDDYTVLDGSPVVIPAGTTSYDIPLSIVDDTLYEPGETVHLDLGPPEGGTLGATTEHLHTLKNDDAPPTVSFAAAASAAGEGTGQALISVQLSAVSGTDVTVPFLLGGSAETPGDYALVANPLVLPAGTISADVVVTLVADDVHEGPEIASIQMGTPVGADPGAITTHDLTINDDDPAPTVRFELPRQYALESAAPVALQVLVEGETALDITVPFSADGEAILGVDYEISASPLVIPAGQSSGVVLVTPLDDLVDEDRYERVIVRMEPPLDGASEGSPSVTRVFLEDDDGPGFGEVISGLRPDVTQLEFAQARVGEAGAPVQVTFTNTQELPVTFKKIVFEDDLLDEFEVSYPQPPPLELQQNESVVVDLTFAPQENGPRRARARAKQTPAGAPPGAVDLAGIALGPTGADVIVNVGPEKHVDGTAQVWSEDYGAVGTSTYLVYGGGIAGTSEVPLYQSARVGAGFGYALEVPDGAYDVVLHFAETEVTGAGQRVFDVFVENQPVVDDLDLFVTAGYAAAYVTAPYRVDVVDGIFDLDVAASVGEGLLSAFELRSVPVLQQDASVLDFGIVDQGFFSEKVLTVTNTGLHDGHASQLAFVMDQSGQGTAEDFYVRIGGVDFYGGVSTVYHAIDLDLPAGEATPISIFFEPTRHEDNAFRIEFSGNFETLAVDVIGTGGADAGWGFLHPVPDWSPKLVVDYDEDLTEEVLFFGQESHTHEPGQTLAAFEWKVDGVTVSTKMNDRIDLALGKRNISLTITDDKAIPDSATDAFELRVHHIEGVPGILAAYYDGGSGGANALLDALPPSANYIERLGDFHLEQQDGFVGGSPLSTDVMVRFTGSFQVTGAPRVYEFVPTGGTETRVRIDGAVVNGPKQITKNGRHDIDIRFALATVADMPLDVTVFLDGVEQSSFSSGLIHSERNIVPVIHSMPTLGSELGGNLITIQGFGFFPKDQVIVHWGAIDIDATGFVSWTDEQIELLSPPGTGSVPVTIETPAGESNEKIFIYSPDGPVPVKFNRLDDRQIYAQQATTAVWHPNGKLYVGSLSGKIYEVTYDENWYATSVVAHSGIGGLENHDLLGIAVNPYDPVDPVRLYVAHGEHFLNGGGTFSGPSPYTGQVSILEGPDFDDPIPYITGLPTSNHDHGVNGMVFDNNGDLLICMGGNTNAGVKWPLIGNLDESPLSGAILRARTSLGPAFDGAVTYVDRTTGNPSDDQVYGENAEVASGDVEVFAPGFRNSYDLVLTTWGYFYGSDNGPNWNYGYASTGPNSDTGNHVQTDDEVLLVEAGRYYGHPNRNRGLHDPRQYVYRGVTQPSDELFTQRLGGVDSSTNGMEEYRAATFNSQIRGRLLAQKWNDNQYLIELTPNRRGIASKQELNPFTKGLDVVASPGGAILAIDYSASAVRIMEPDDAAAVGPTVYDIFPWRTVEGTGQPFVIGGDNFDVGGAPTVKIGGVPATVTSYGKRRIRGVFPPLAPNNIGGLYDVTVTIGVDTLTYGGGVLVLPAAPGTMKGFWTTGAPVPDPIGEVAAAVVGTKIYHFGEGSGKTFSYDPINDGWFDGLSARPLQGNHHACEVVGDKVYLIGGFGAGSEGKVQIYDTVADTWSLGAQMPWAGGSCSSAVIGGKIYVCGGIVGSTTVKNLSVYDPGTDTWDAGGASLTPMPKGVNHAASATDGAKLWVFGGRAGGNWPQPGFDTVQCYDPTTDTWDSSDQAQSTLAEMPSGRGGTGKAVLYQGEFHVFGGEDPNQAYGDVFVYDPDANAWRVEEDMPTPRHGVFPVEFKGRVFLAGGGVVEGFSQSTVLEIFQRY